MFKLSFALLLIVNSLITFPSGQSGIVAKVDHLVYATPDLKRGIDEIEKLLGVRAAPGGQHPGQGTRNALISLGPTAYLEIIGPDPDQPAPKNGRTFGIDGLKKSRLVAWAARGTALEALRSSASEKGVQLGELAAGSRKRPDGVLLSWQYTSPRTILADGIIPFFIDWGSSPHPSQSSPKGLSLIDLRAEHPEPKSVEMILEKLGLELSVQAGASPALIAVIDGTRGRVELR